MIILSKNIIFQNMGKLMKISEYEYINTSNVKSVKIFDGFMEITLLSKKRPTFVFEGKEEINEIIEIRRAETIELWRNFLEN